MSASQSDALVFVGATCDLACKKIVPSLHAMVKQRTPHRRVLVIGWLWALGSGLWRDG